jgi:subtilisin family serine protease
MKNIKMRLTALLSTGILTFAGTNTFATDWGQLNNIKPDKKQNQSDKKEIASPDRFIAKPKKGPNQKKIVGDIAALHANQKAKVVKKFSKWGDIQVIQIEKGGDLNAIIKRYQQSGLFEYIELNYFFEAFATPDDPYFEDGSLWGLHNTGQGDPSGTADADIDAPEAWNIRTSADSVIVAVIDTGVRYTHGDLQQNMWANPGEIPGDGVDNDNNGYIDDVHGIDAIPRSPAGSPAPTGNPIDTLGHGTHVAGTIAAVGNNDTGVVGVAWNAKIMACKWLYLSQGIITGRLEDALTCIEYAQDNGASIINASWGGGQYAKSLRDAIDDLRADGIIFVAAAGNSAENIEDIYTYPAGHQQDNIVSVAATTRTDGIAYFSNIGRYAVDIGAPGHEIWSTWVTSDSAYYKASGTSMATPHVAGALALLRAEFPTANYRQLIYRLFANVDYIPSLTGKTLTGGRLNIHKALASGSVSVPANNDLSGAATLPLDGVSVVRFASNVGANKETGEPNHAGNTGGKSVWWTWRAPSSGRVSITTAGSLFDTLLAVYTGTSVGSLTQIAANDDSGFAGDGSTTSFVTFNVTPGQIFQVAVDGKNGASGWLKLAIDYTAGNDDFANSTALGGDFIGVTADNSAATSETSEPTHAGVAGGKSVWYSWKAPSSGTVTLSTRGSNFDTILAVYTGSSLSGLTTVASNDDYIILGNSLALGGDHGGKTSQLTFSAVAGTLYRIVVSGRDGDFGIINLTGGYHYSFQTHGGIANKVNDSGTIVGFSPTGAAAIWTGSWQDLGLGGSGGVNGINDFGVIVGGKDDRAIRLTPGSAYVNLFSGTDATYPSVAWRINNSGEITGTITPGGDFYWTQAGGKVLLGNFDGTPARVADMNDEGLILGNSTSKAFLWDARNGGTLRELSINGGEPSSVNKSGQIVGRYFPQRIRAFTWQGGTFKDLGTLNFGDSVALDGNDSGDVVGSAGLHPMAYGSFVPYPKGFISPRGGRLIELDMLTDNVPDPSNPWSTWFNNGIWQPYAINNHGHILTLCGSLGRQAILTPIAKLRITNPARLSNGNFQFDVKGPNGSCYIETSSDLYTWSGKGTLTIAGGTASYTDTTAGSSTSKYYRVRSGNSYSINAVGFVSKNIPVGQSLIGSPLILSDPRVTALFANNPEITEFWKLNRETESWDEFERVSGVWEDDQEGLLHGEAAMIYATDSTILTFVGEVAQGQLRLELGEGWNAISSLLPFEGFLEAGLGMRPLQETIYRWDNLTANYFEYAFANYAWNMAPWAYKCEGLLVYTPHEQVYERSFSVWQNVAISDSDSDSLVDTWELDNFGNLSQTAAQDPDNDGWSNGQEQQYGSNPTSASSYPFGWVSGGFNGNNYQLTANGVSGLTCDVYGSSDATTWTQLGTVTLTGGTGTFTDTGAGSYSHRFYRLTEGTACAGAFGFMNVAVPAGQKVAVANQLSAGANTLETVLPSVVSGTRVHKQVSGSWSVYTYNAVSGWSTANVQWPVGEGMFVENQGTQAFTITFNGKLASGSLVNLVPTAYSMRGSMVPRSATLVDLGYVPSDGDYIYFWNPTTDAWDTVYLYADGYGWVDADTELPADPTPQVGEAFFIYTSTAKNWGMNYSPCD